MFVKIGLWFSQHCATLQADLFFLFFYFSLTMCEELWEKKGREKKGENYYGSFMVLKKIIHKQ